MAFGCVALADDHADFGRADLFGNPVEFTQSEEQQISRHFRASLECHFLKARACGLCRGDGHIAHRHLVFGHNNGQIEGSLVVRLIPAGHETPGVGSFELSEQCALFGTFWVFIVKREEAVGLLVNLAGIGCAESVFSWRQLLGEPERRGLRFGIDVNFGGWHICHI